jgi:F-type H+-transporting ATPase subunit delta
MSAQSVARQYAHALFAVAHKSQQADVVGRELMAVVALLDEHPELQVVFDTPVVATRNKRALVDALIAAGGELSAEVRRLLQLLADNDRLVLVREIAKSYAARALDAAGVVTAEVVTALEIGEDRKAALANALGRATGKQVQLTGRVDPSIIGGAVARVGTVIYDGSVVRQLERMRQRLSAEG